MDHLEGMHPETRELVAQADVIRAELFGHREDIAKFASLMFAAGFSECQHTIELLLGPAGTA